MPKKEATQTPFIENLLVWRGLANAVTIGILLVGAVYSVVAFSMRQMAIEEQHVQLNKKIDSLTEAVVACQEQVKALQK